MCPGIDGSIGVERVCPANAGSTLTFEFHDRPDIVTSGAIDSSHKGPCAVYMKKVDSAVANDTAKGDGWFKICMEADRIYPRRLLTSFGRRCRLQHCY